MLALAASLGAVRLGLNAMQSVLQGADEDATAVIGGYLALLDQRDGSHQSLNGTGILAWWRVLRGGLQSVRESSINLKGTGSQLSS